MSYMMLCVVGLASIGCPFAEEAVPARPTSHYVLDQTNTLSAPEIAKIDQIAKEVETNKKVSVAVLMVASTNGEDIAQYAHRVAEKWKPGIDGVGKGALVVIAKNDRKSRIETSKNLEGEVTDAAAKGILIEAGAHFKRGQFGEGLHDIVRDIGAKTGVAVVEKPVESSNADSILIAILTLLGVGGIGGFFVKRHFDKEAEKRRQYLLQQEKAYQLAEAERLAARRARERAEQERRATASTAIAGMAFAPAYAAPLAATAGLSGAQIKKPLDIRKSPEPPKAAPKPVKKEEPRRSSSYDSYPSSSYSSSDSYSSSSRSSSSSSYSSSDSSSSSFSSSSSSDSGGGGSSSDW